MLVECIRLFFLLDLFDSCRVLGLARAAGLQNLFSFFLAQEGAVGQRVEEQDGLRPCWLNFFVRTGARLAAGRIY